MVNPVVDDRTPFSALPSPYGPWEEKERRKKEKEIGGEEVLEVWGRTQEVRRTNSHCACQHPSRMRSSVLGALEESEKKGKSSSQCVVELRQMCSLYYSYLVFACTFSFSEHAQIQVQITCL